MKKTNLLKLFLSLIISVMIILVATTVNAAEGFNDITNTLTNNSATTDNSSNTSNLVGNNSSNTNTSNTNNSNTDSLRNNTNSNRTNNSSIYNNTNLPSTGIGDTLPIAALVVVFGISAVYAYRKIKDYRNI